MNIQGILKKGLKKFGDKEYIFERKTASFFEEKNDKIEFEAKTYKEFIDDVNKVASFLKNKGLDGEKIAIFAKNSYNYMVADIAIMGFLKSVCVTVPKDWTTEDLKNAIDFLDIKSVIFGEEQAEVIDNLKDNCKGIQFTPIETILDWKVPDFKPEPINSDEIAKIVFTSGTTGVPKAVQLTQDSMFTLLPDLMARTPLDENDSNYLFLPLSHVYAGICVFLYSLVTGMSIYLCSNTDEIIPELMTVKPTSFCAVSVIYRRIYDYCQANNVSPKAIFGKNIKYLYCGAANFEPEVKQWLKDNKLPIVHSYGMTETSSLIALEYVKNDNPIETVGTICEHMKLKIDEPDENGVGEILVKGGNVTSGYYGVDNSKYFDNDGFFKTGDLGRREGDLLFVTGRKKRVIVFDNGENIYPDDVEEKIKEISGVTSVRVFEKNGKLAAMVFVKNEQNPKLLKDEINQKLTKYSQIEDLIIKQDVAGARMK